MLTVAPDNVWYSERKAGQRINPLQEANLIFMNKQASLLAATSHAAKVCELKQRLERAENELGEVKIQLQEKQGE